MAGSSKIWAGLNSVTELAKKTDVPAPYVHPSSKVCAGGDAGTLNGKTAAQIIASATTGAIYVKEYIGTATAYGDSDTIQQFTLPSTPRAIIVFRIDGRFYDGANINTYPFGVVTPTSPYFYITYDGQWSIYINDKILSVRNVTDYQTSGFNEQDKGYIILGLLWLAAIFPD